jgi:hypothetical protein
MKKILFLAMILGACGGRGGDERVAAFARAHGAAGELRVSTDTALSTDRTHFYRVDTSDRELLVVVPSSGEPFDASTPDAFSRVTQAEEAGSRIAQLGADKVALWYIALGGKCPALPEDPLHFASFTRAADGAVTVSYQVADADTGCVIQLEPNGSVRQARAEAILPPHVYVKDPKQW